MGSDIVIKKIEEKAFNEAEEIRINGEKQAEELKDRILKDTYEKALTLLQTAKAEAKQHIRIEKQKAELAARLSTLATKQNIIDETRLEAKKELSTLSDEKWKELFTKLILEHCMSGEVKVKIPSEDKGRYEKRLLEKSLLDKWSKQLTEKHGTACKLTIDSEFADIEGGMILQGTTYDVDLSFHSLIDNFFENNEKEISEKLFN